MLEMEKVEIKPLKLYKLPEDDKERLSLYDRIFLNAIKKRDQDNQCITLEIGVHLVPSLPSGVALTVPYDWLENNSLP